MKLRTLGVLATVFAVAFSACNQAPAGSGGTSKGTVKFAIELPQQGSEKAASDPIINGVKLALKQANNTAGGYTIELPQSAIYDDALNGAHDPQTGANNMSKVVADPNTQFSKARKARDYGIRILSDAVRPSFSAMASSIRRSLPVSLIWNFSSR